MSSVSSTSSPESNFSLICVCERESLSKLKHRIYLLLIYLLFIFGCQDAELSHIEMWELGSYPHLHALISCDITGACTLTPHAWTSVKRMGEEEAIQDTWNAPESYSLVGQFQSGTCRGQVVTPLN